MRTIIIIASLFVAALGTGAARAHAFLDHSSPLVGSTMRSAPRQLTLWFTQNLEPAFSSVEVLNGSGARVDRGRPQISANIMRVGLKPLAPGSYTVRWRVLSVDTHTTEGSFTFRVGG
jgi:copper resistance protein C